MGRLLRRLFGATALLGAAGGVAYYQAQPVYNTCEQVHRPYNNDDLAAMRGMGGTPVSAEHNPGVRVTPEFVTPKEATAILKEVKPMMSKMGIDLIQPLHRALYHFQMSYLPQPPPVNMLRLTGRPEHPRQQVAPWGYGDKLDESKLPPQLRLLAQRIRQLPGMNLGQLRDVTINYRHSYFMRLDPHLDPALDGDNVFILGLESDTVLTLCPLKYWQLTKVMDTALGLLTLEDERALVQRQAEASSWTSKDVDVLSKERSLLHICGDARWTWTHGTRLGKPVPGMPGLHDWWGTPDNVVPRAEHRTSIVFAFAKPGETFEGKSAGYA